MSAIPRKRFIVKYRGAEDALGPVMDWRCYAYNAEHAEMKFLDSGAAEEGWEVVSVDRPRTVRGKVDAQYDKAGPVRVTAEGRSL